MFETMPKRTRKCPGCKKDVHVGPWGTLVTAASAKAAATKREIEDAESNAMATRERVISELQRFRSIGIDAFTVSTCGDERTCRPCRAQEGKRYSVRDALKSPPVPHPACAGSCRCTIIAVIPGLEGK